MKKTTASPSRKKSRDSKKSTLPTLVTARVPATTANLGPGFDCLGVALSLYNTVTVEYVDSASKLTPFLAQAARLFFDTTDVMPFPFTVSIEGEVPISRGLGSSVTVRLGLIAALNTLCGGPLHDEELLRLVIDLEGHPDNAVPAFYGGFAACASGKFVRTEVESSLKFVAFVPDTLLETKQARAVLPKRVPLADAVHNLQRTALITAAFLQRHYEAMSGLFDDRLHQPARAPLIEGWGELQAAALEAGALGFFLSGAGSTTMALTTGKAKPLAEALAATAARLGITGTVHTLKADNQGLQLS